MAFCLIGRIRRKTSIPVGGRGGGCVFQGSQPVDSDARVFRRYLHCRRVYGHRIDGPDVVQLDFDVLEFLVDQIVMLG